MEEKELISMIEDNHCNLEGIRAITDLLFDLVVFDQNRLKEYEIRDNYTAIRTLIITLFKLIQYEEKESSENIDKIYKSRKG